jgi:DNA-directed RNA polymerase beta subunit
MIAANFVMLNAITISTSAGDLIDRITILKLKSDRIKNENQLKHIRIELNLLLSSYNKIIPFLKNYPEINKLENELMDINATLWDYEDQIRQQVNDADIAKVAKAIIQANDLRSSTKYEINLLLNSDIVEEKSYSM